MRILSFVLIVLSYTLLSQKNNDNSLRIDCRDSLMCYYYFNSFSKTTMNIKGNHDWNRNNNFCDSVELEIFLSGLKIHLDHFLNLKIKDKHYAKDSFKVIEIKDRGCISKKKVFLKLQIPIYLNGQIIQKKEEFQLLNHIKSYKFIRIVRRLFNEDKIEIWTR